MTQSERDKACKADVAPHRSAASAQTDLERRLRESERKAEKWEEQFEELHHRLEENEKNTGIQTEILEEIRKALQGPLPPDQEKSGASRQGASKGVKQAQYVEADVVASHLDHRAKDCQTEYVHFRHAARIVSDRPDVSRFEALIYEGMFLELYNDGTFRLNYVMETPNTDVVMRLQFVVFVADEHGQYTPEVLPRTITLPPIKFSRRADRRAFDERVFWTVGQTGFSPYLALGTRNAECRSRVLIRKAEAEFGSTPDRPEY